MKQGRNLAVHEVRMPDGSRIRQAVVTLTDGVVTQCRAFTGELPMTEWLGGTIVVEAAADGSLWAYRDGVRLI